VKTKHSVEPPLTIPPDNTVEIGGISTDGKTLATIYVDKSIVQLWDIASRQALGAPLISQTDADALGGQIRTVAFSSDGTLVAIAGGDSTIRLWNTVAKQQWGQPLIGHTGFVNQVVFSPDGKLLASGSSDGTVRLWDVESQQPLGGPLNDPNDNVIGFSSDGKLLATRNDTGIVQAWPVTADGWDKLACQIANRNLTLDEWNRYFGDEPYHKTCVAQ
jgi:WD40 repeat protein